MVKEINRDYSPGKAEDKISKEEAKKKMWKEFFAKGGVIEKIPYKVTKDQLKKGKW